MNKSQDIQQSNSWKLDLRELILSAISNNTPAQNECFEKIGYYYKCYAPCSLYKYYSDKPEKLDFVKDGKLWYSALCKFNDTFDGEISIDDNEVFRSCLEAYPDKRGLRAGSQMWREMQKSIYAELRAFRNLWQVLRSSTGVACLSESDSSLLMWAHYANNHRGMCVEYNLFAINEQLKFTPVPVIYSADRTRFSFDVINNIEASSFELLINCLTTKSPEWNYEKEWRIIRDNAACGDKWDPQKGGALLEMIQPSSITLGCEATKEFSDAVQQYCRENKINLYKMEKDNLLYRLNKKAILQFDT